MDSPLLIYYRKRLARLTWVQDEIIAGRKLATDSMYNELVRTIEHCSEVIEDLENEDCDQEYYKETQGWEPSWLS